MTIWSASAIGAMVTDASIDLYEIFDNRLRFKEGSHGTITARFLVTAEAPWRKTQLTYRWPGNNLRFENYVRARLMQISRTSGEADLVLGISSEGHASDSDEIQSIRSTALEGNVDFNNFFYYVEIIMRRALIIPEIATEALLTLSDGPRLAQYEGKDTEPAKTPSVPIPPPLTNRS